MVYITPYTVGEYEQTVNKTGKVIGQTRLMDGEEDEIMGVGRRGQERREVMEKGQGKGTDTLQTNNVFTREEYIEREAAVMKIREWFWSAPGVHPKLDRDAAEEIMFAIPAADVVPARHGWWKRIDYEPLGHDYICSVCGGKNDRASQYCPDCGARMDMVTDSNQVKDGDGDV